MESSIINQKISKSSKNSKTIGSVLTYSKEDLNKMRAEFYALERKMSDCDGEITEDEKRQYTSLCNILTINGVKLNPRQKG